MIIKRIAALCKAEKNIILLDCDDGTQWVGDGRGFYQLVGMPELGEQSICAVMDIPPEKAAEMKITRKKMPEAYDPEKAGGVSGYLEFDDGKCVTFLGRTLMPVKNREGIRFIQPKYLKPLGDLDNITLESGGRRFLIANDGMFPVAFILVEPVPELLVSWLAEVSMAARAEELENKQIGRENNDDDI